MSSRLNFFYRQKVTEAELDLAFELLEQADHNLAADMGVLGVISGAAPTEHAPVADLTIDLTAPARAYDALGQRIAFGTGQRVDCAVDATGIPTEVSTAGQERWLGVFLKFDRLLSDPRTDGNSQQVFFRQDESFQLFVRQGPQGPEGAAPKVPLEENALLLCDVRRRAGQAQIRSTDLDLGRRQAFVFVRGDAVGIAPALWTVLAPVLPTVQATFDSTDDVLREHFTGAANRHAASAVSVPPHGFISSDNVQDALHELINDLSLFTAGIPGARRISTNAVPGTPNALAASNVDTQLGQLLGFVNAHQGAVTAAHAAAAVGVTDAGGNLGATNVEAALAELASAHHQDHFRGTDASPGQHRTIRQPVLADVSTKALLWDAQGTGVGANRLRVYADVDWVWFVANAHWSGLSWERDVVGTVAGGFRFSRFGFEFFNDQTALGSWVNWERRWRLPTGSAVASGFELSGPVQEVGRIGLHGTNTHTAARSVQCGASVTFRNRFSATPSSITLSFLAGDNAFVPIVHAANRDGFAIRTSREVGAGGEVFWHGTYTAIP